MNIALLAEEIHQNAKNKGFYDTPLSVGELLMLVVSELGEAMEAHRKGRFVSMADFDTVEEHGVSAAFESTIKDTFEDEIADAIIRLLDLSEFLQIDIEKHIKLKMQYNATRERLHGKKY